MGDPEEEITMKSRFIGNLSVWVGVVSMALGTAVMAQAATSSGQGAHDSHLAARLLREIKADGLHVESAAAELDKLTRSSSATWLDYDRQWNEIDPSVEDMELKLARLEAIESSATPDQRSQIDQSKRYVLDIQTRTSQLRALLDSPGVQTSDAKFKTYARSLMGEAGKLDKMPATS